MRSPTQRWFVMVLVTVALCGSLFIPGASLYRWDALLYNWPLALETRAQLLSGHWPFWAESFCNGTPLLENINAGVLYPLRALIWVLPLQVGYALFLALHVLLSLVAMERLLRRGFCTRGWGPLAGALVYAASGYGRGMWDTHNFMALPWLPLGLCALMEARREEGLFRATSGVAATWAMLILSGDLQAACLWVPVAGLLAILDRARVRLISALAAGVALGVALSAIQWLPAWSAAQESYRSGGLDMAESLERSFHPLRLLELALPYVFGTRDTWSGAALMGEGAVRLSPWTSSLHIGTVSLVAIGLALRRKHGAITRWGALVAGGALLLSFGRFLPGFTWWQSLPVISAFRYPEKYLLWVTLALAVLAGRGFADLHAWTRIPQAQPVRARFLRISAWLLLAGSFVVVLAVRPSWPVALAGLALNLVSVVALLRAARGSGAWLALALVVSLLGAWQMEKPVTRHFKPLSPPLTLQPVKGAGPAGGRVLCDPAVKSVPLPPGFNDLRPTERQSIFYCETWMFNSPRLWGCATAGGFSPTESRAMRELRGRLALPEAGAVSAPADLAQFCRWSAVEWLLTTPARLAQLREAGLPAEQSSGWGQPHAVVLARVKNPSWVETWSGSTARVVGLWRPRAGFIRIDLEPGGQGWLKLADSYGRGWRAVDQLGQDLRTDRLADAFLGVEVQATTRQIRLHYEPVLWGMASRIACGASILWIGCLLWRRRRQLSGDLRKPWVPVAAAVLVATLLGLSARGQWACTFDEGFHVARGIGWRTLHDSRLSYFHPPLQNAAAGYFADLAWGDQLDAAPDAPGWQSAEVQAYSAEFAARNRDRFQDIVQAARWGSSLLFLLLCTAGICAARAWGGPLAGWLAAAGLALQPALLAHGNLATTDMGVAAFAVLGTVLLARTLRQEQPQLLGPVLAFVAAAGTKHSGLIWLGTLLFVVVPILALRRRKVRLLAWIPIGALLLVTVLILLYGPTAQAIRYGAGGAWPAGRFVEGLLRQSDHALEGHRAFLAGRVFVRGSWWHAPLTLLLKTPEVWSAAALWALTMLVRPWRKPLLIALLPAIVFAGLLMFAGKLSLGVRHLLPLLALGVIGGAVAVARLRRPAVRLTAAVALAVGSAMSATVWPHYIAYVPAWAGGLANGPNWVLDSNYDWGQEAGTLEESWAGLVDANAGIPPTLYYFGFMDPSYIYRLPVGRGSYLGFMSRGPEVTNAPPSGRVTVASVSALGINPHGLPLSAVTNGLSIGDLGPYIILRQDGEVGVLSGRQRAFDCFFV